MLVLMDYALAVCDSLLSCGASVEKAGRPFLAVLEDWVRGTRRNANWFLLPRALAYSLPWWVQVRAEAKKKKTAQNGPATQVLRAAIAAAPDQRDRIMNHKLRKVYDSDRA